MPTISDAGGLEQADYMDGVSILPTLRGESGKQVKRDYLYWEFYEKGTQQAVRMGKWKAYRRDGIFGEIELYDIENDIGEENNLAANHPEMISKINGIMEKEHGEHPRYRLDKQAKSKK